MSINLPFTEQDWTRLEQNWGRWWAGELDRPLVVLESPELINRRPHELTRAFLLESDPDELLDYYQSRLEQTRFYADAWPKWWPFFGAGVTAAFLGARLKFTPHVNTIWFEPVVPLSLDTADLTYEANNRWWQRVQTLTQRAVQRWGTEVCLGFTDLGGNLDILASLRTTQTLLLDLVDSPEAVARLCGQITRLWLRYYDEQYQIIRKAGRGSTAWAPIWSPGRCYMFQSDLSYMISPKMFERFVMPDLATCCAHVDHAFYHLDGKGQLPHLDRLLSLETLHGIQWIPGDGQPPAHQWLPVLKRIRAGGKLCQLYVTPEGAHAIVNELGGRGFAFYITPPPPEDEIDDFLKTLLAAGNRGGRT
jgi:5-methyltetrahydrofolate--homocysteine methyltransferase